MTEPSERRGASPEGADLPAALVQEALTLCLDVHGEPELSGQEVRTAAKTARWLGADGLLVRAGVGGHGVVGTLANGKGPHVALRAELDALPVQERTGLPYASRATGLGPGGVLVPVMHACGHDLHLAAVLGAARALSAARATWSGQLTVIAQPAEETLQGARAMLADGLYDRGQQPDVVLAQHCAPLPAGTVAHGHGPLLAAGQGLRVTVHGDGGHAGTPQLGVDPVVTAAAVVTRLQAVVARETGPAEPVVVSVGSLHAGVSPNVTPEQATLEITVRTMAEASLDRVTEAVRRVVHGECAASGCRTPPTIELTARSPVTRADPGVAAEVRTAHLRGLGPRRVLPSVPSMATEDFGLFGPAGRVLHGHHEVRTAYWLLGTASASSWRASSGDVAERLAAQTPNHSPLFAPDVRVALPTGIQAMVLAARSQLARPVGR